MRKMSCISFVAIYILLFVVSVNAQLKNPPIIQWQRSLGGSGNDYVQSVQQTSDGGYIVAGESGSPDGDVTGSYGGGDYWIVKLTATGETQWQKSLGGSTDDFARSIQQTTDGGYIVAGVSTSPDGDVTGNHGNSDYWIVKLTSTGEIDWQKSLGGSSYDEAYSIQQTTDGGYIVAGKSLSADGDVTGNHGSSDFWIVKLTSAGVIQWQKSIGGSNSDEASSIEQTLDGGYIVAGWSESADGDVSVHHGAFDKVDFWVVKLNDTGAIQWQQTLGGKHDDVVMSIKQTTDGGYIVAGYSYSSDEDVTGHHGNNSYIDFWVVKLNEGGVMQWERSLGGSRSEIAFSIEQTKDNGYIVAGSSESDDGDVSVHHGAFDKVDFWVVKLNDTGFIQWEQVLGGKHADWAKSIQQTVDGGYVVAGYSNSNDGDVTGNHGNADYWIVKLGPETPSSVEFAPANTQTTTITPNPATSSATLSLQSDEEGICEVQIISVTGATLKQYSTRLTNGKQEIALTDLESLPTGMYEVSVKRNGYLITQTKLIIE